LQVADGASSTSSAETGDACSVLKTGTLAALVPVAIGSSYDEPDGEPDDFHCWYGIGPAADLMGDAIVTSMTDTLLVTKINHDGASDYRTTARVYSGVTALSGIGDMASYSLFFGNVVVLAYQGDVYCEVQTNLGNASEVGLPASPAGVSESDAPMIAQKEAALCLDVFAGG
jgi:hypothetical protein